MARVDKVISYYNAFINYPLFSSHAVRVKEPKFYARAPQILDVALFWATSPWYPYFPEDGSIQSLSVPTLKVSKPLQKSSPSSHIPYILTSFAAQISMYEVLTESNGINSIFLGAQCTRLRLRIILKELALNCPHTLGPSKNSCAISFVSLVLQQPGALNEVIKCRTLLNGALLSLQVSLYRNLTVAGMSVTQYT
jgi:hypothetical protein